MALIPFAAMPTAVMIKEFFVNVAGSLRNSVVFMFLPRGTIGNKILLCGGKINISIILTTVMTVLVAPMFLLPHRDKFTFMYWYCIVS